MGGAEDRLKKRILTQGPVSFHTFMDEALYGDEGYYCQREAPIGPQGDYVTGSSACALFALTTARLVARLDGALGRPADYFEMGYGGGEHAVEVAKALRGAGVRRRLLAADRVCRELPAEIQVVEQVEEVGERELEGLVFSYELFDALPVHRLVRRGEALCELHVALEGGAFVWQEGEMTDPRLDQWNAETLAEGQVIDVTPEWGDLYGAMARRLRRGVVVTCDYGFTRERLLDARVRLHGTLACYRHHRVHRNPFVEVGKQDLTAHVDFTSLEEAGLAAGFETVGLFRQAEWLATLGILDSMESRSPSERVEILSLMNLEGMGEEIQVLVQSLNVEVGEILPRPR